MPKLETGMIVEVKDHAHNDTRVGLVINNSIMYIINSDGFDKVCDGRADFSTSYVSKIYSGFDPYKYSINYFTNLYRTGELSEFLIWEKEDTLEVTMEEVCELKSKNKYYKQLLKEVLPIINVINHKTIDNLDLNMLSEEIFQVVVKD